MSKVRSITDCASKHKAKGLCQKHYRQQYYKDYYIRNKTRISEQQKQCKERINYKPNLNSKSSKKSRDKWRKKISK